MTEGESLYLKKNVGPVDRVFRIVLGLVLIISPVLLQWSPWSTAILAALGGATMLEGIISY